MKFPSYIQYNVKDCGPSCLRIISKFYGKEYSLSYLRELCQVSREGTSIVYMSEAAKSLGYNTSFENIQWEELRVRCNEFPCIVHLRQNHIVVLYNIDDSSEGKVYISDPAIGLLTYNKTTFINSWLGEDNCGVVLFLKPSPQFDTITPIAHSNPIVTQLRGVAKAIKPYKSYFLGMFLTVCIALSFNFLMPYLSQSVVDKGINRKDVSFIVLILIAQVMVVVGQTTANIVRNIITLKVSTNINIDIVSNFLSKMLKLPISFFETTLIGDVIQRIRDCDRLQLFFTTTIVSIIVSFLSIVIYAIILGKYNMNVFVVIILGSLIYVLWIMYFLRYRKKLDYQRFQESSISQNNIVEMFEAINEIKLHQIENSKINEWKQTQTKLYDISLKRLNVAHVQEAGGIFIDQIKNVIMSFFAATSVIDGSMTLGMMMAMQYIMGQINTPILQFVQFLQLSQDAKIAMERINEVHEMSNEDSCCKNIEHATLKADIRINDLTFKYPGAQCYALAKINLVIPYGKTTAIVGASGCGKTTLLKLLLKFYHTSLGDIYIGDKNLNDIMSSEWRAICGVVMQNGYIFPTTIEENITLCGTNSNSQKNGRMVEVAKLALLDDYVNALPRKYKTIVGKNGIGLSSGQKQRLLIARTLYKNADYIFLDEATNSLDTKNEATVVRNLNDHCKNKTLVVIAHRLSTVKSADQIVVMDSGRIVEIGKHNELISKKGYYYNLVKDQLELDK